MIEIGHSAPDVLLQTPDGDDVRLSEEFRRHPTLLVFFKQDCPACKVAVPRTPRFLESYAGLQVWAISQDDPAATREFLVEQAPSLPVLIDAPDYTASETYAIFAVPTMLLVGVDGTVVETMVGWDRDRFNELSRAASALVDAPYRELVPEGDGPAFRPG